MSRSKTVIVLLLALLVLTTLGLAGFPGVTYTVREVVAKKPAADAESEEMVPAIEFEVTGKESFPVRALDPVLHVGKTEVRYYRYAGTENKTLIFTLFERGTLEDDVPVYLQYENDESTHTDLANFRLSMIKSSK